MRSPFDSTGRHRGSCGCRRALVELVVVKVVLEPDGTALGDILNGQYSAYPSRSGK